MANEKTDMEVTEAVEQPVVEEKAPKAKRRGERPQRDHEREAEHDRKDEMEEVVININRCAKVVKGGKNFSFGALIVVGDRKGKVGYGYAKANEVSDAIRKAQEVARKHLITVPRFGNTIPHTVLVKYSGSKILLRPASAGTGVIAGGAMRAVLDLAGIVDVLGKSLGSGNAANVVKATFKAIEMMKSKKAVLEKRGLA